MWCPGRTLALVLTLGALGCGGTATAPTAPTPPVPPAFVLRVSEGVSQRASEGPFDAIGVLYSACYQVFPVNRAATAEMALSVFGPGGEEYDTQLWVTEPLRFVPGTSYGGCGGGTSVIDYDLTHAVAKTYRLTLRYTTATDNGVIEGTATVRGLVRTPTAPVGVVINEVRTYGRNGLLDQFIELKNVTSDAIAMNRWQIIGSDVRGRSGFPSIAILSAVLNPGCHFLMTLQPPFGGGGGYSGPVPGEPGISYFNPFPLDGGIALFNNVGEAVDQVGFSYGSLFREGTPLPPLPQVVIDQSYERHAGDSGDNAADFIRHSGSPRNSSGCQSSSTVAARPGNPATRWFLSAP